MPKTLNASRERKGQESARDFLSSISIHQEEARQSIKEAFLTDDRITVLSACGTGKTLIGIYAAEDLNSKFVIVFVPSLALLKQTLLQWKQESKFAPLNYLCVCSDRTITETDDIGIEDIGQDNPVTTNPIEVRKFLTDLSRHPRIIFCTYHSSDVVRLGIPEGFAFDIGIMDEAHKTATLEENFFNLPLDEAAIPIKKRIFFTATLRHHFYHNKNADGTMALAYSMDNESVYGKIVYKLPLREAIRKNIICDYKIIVSVVTNSMVDDEMIRTGNVTVSGNQVDSRDVANAIAIKQAIDQYGAKKVITFHGRVNQAKMFVENDFAKSEFADLCSLYIHGGMKSSERQTVMTAFESSEVGLISNARCLSEGVDVPAIDLVGFLSHKKSTIDIVQAIGRSLRKAPGKTVGYVLLPLFIPDTKDRDDVDRLLADSEYRQLWDVLQAIKEQDDLVALEVESAQVLLGESNNNSNMEFFDVISGGESVDLEYLKKSISVHCLEAIGEEWDVMFGRLLAFKSQFGNCNVPIAYCSEDGALLGDWCATQRSAKDNNQLSKYKISRLEAIEFTWSLLVDRFERNFERLLAFKIAYGHCLVPESHVDGDPYAISLGAWCKNIRIQANLGTLSDDQVARLTEIGFAWDDSFERLFNRLVAFSSQFGHCNVPPDYNEVESLTPKLGSIVSTLRAKFKRKDLDLIAIKRLEAIGFKWDLYDANFEHFIERLIKFKTQFGHCDVPMKYNDEAINCPHLGSKCGSVRLSKRKGTFSAKHAELLESMGFKWSILDDRFETNIARLIAYREQHGDCNVPRGYDDGHTNKANLGVWCQTMRGTRKSGLLDEDLARRLEEIGFSWNLVDDNFERFFEKLLEYRKESDDWRPTKSEQGGKWAELAAWVARTRSSKKKGKLSATSILRLDAIGFEWEPLEEQFRANFERLQAYEKEYGNFSVPPAYDDGHSPNLNIWCSSQRTLKNSGQMPAHRVKEFNEIGFVWSFDLFEIPYKKLVAFQSEFGHCFVPQEYDEKLWGRCCKWRNEYKSGKLDGEKIKQLESIGFVWSKYEEIFNANLNRLSAFIKKFGHSSVTKSYVEAEGQNGNLAAWTSKLRNQKRMGTLAPERVKQLESIGFTWDPLYDNFELNFARVQTFKELHGHCEVPKRFNDDAVGLPSLGTWCSSMRIKKRNGTLEKENESKLDSIGFRWFDPKV